MTPGITDENCSRAEPISTTATRVIISANPRAGARSSIERITPVKQLLESFGWHVHVTNQLSELAQLATAWHAAGELRAVVAAGGDGTASAVCNAIACGVPIIPLPLGTECLLARYVGQRATADAVHATLTRGVVVKLDAGRVNDRLFLLMMSVGLDAAVVDRLQSSRTGHITHLSYLKPTWHALRNYKYPPLYLHCHDEQAVTTPLVCRWVFAFNLPCYARDLKFAPQASGRDGLLEVCTFARGSWWNAVRYLWHVFRSRHTNLPDTQFFRGRKFRVEAAAGIEVAVQVDGDRAGKLPVDVEVLSDRLTLLVPPGGARRLGFAVPGE